MKKNLPIISVIGDGSWGTTLAVYLARKGHRVNLWGAFPDNVNKIRKTRTNPKFLPGIKIPARVHPLSDLNQALEAGQIILLAVPSQFLISVLKNIDPRTVENKVTLSVVKGIDPKSLRRISQLITQYLPVHDSLAVLSGPTIATEVAHRIPSTAVIAARDLKLAQYLQNIFNSDSFRIYTNTDIIGLELGGSLKNVIALACGVCDGLGYGTNTKAAILTRGLVEISRLGQAMGAQPKTFSGLAGLGDLVTTCMSPNSRNRSVGEALGKGKSIREITAKMAMVAEGVETVKAVVKLGQKYQIDLPISREVYRIIYRRKHPKKAMSDLMSRKTKSE